MDARTSKDEALTFFATIYGGAHHIPGDTADGEKNLKPWGLGWCVYDPGDLASFDYDRLTALVFLAHDQCFRVSIQAHGRLVVRIGVWKRARTGHFAERHPTLAQAIERWRTSNPEPRESMLEARAALGIP